MGKTLKKATELPDMSDWTDEEIERWADEHDLSELMKKAFEEKKKNKNVKKNQATSKHSS